MINPEKLQLRSIQNRKRVATGSISAKGRQDFKTVHANDSYLMQFRLRRVGQ